MVNLEKARPTKIPQNVVDLFWKTTDYDVEDEEMIIYHITYNILENWFIVEPVVSKTAEVYLSESEIEILLNKIQDNIH